MNKIKNLLRYIGIRTGKVSPFEYVSPEERRDVAINHYKDIIEENYKGVSEEMRTEYAKMYYMFHMITGVQHLEETSNIYGLVYKTDDIGMSLEIIQKQISSERFPLDINTNTLKPSVNLYSVLHSIQAAYVEELLKVLFSNGSFGEDISATDATDAKNLRVFSMKIANDIGAKTGRGVGNIMIVDSKNVHMLRDYFRIFPPAAINECKKIQEVDSGGSLRYEFTVNNHLKVFSTPLFDTVKEEMQEEYADSITALMLYNGHGAMGGTDSPALLAVGDLFGKDSNADRGSYHTSFAIKTIDYVQGDAVSEFSKAENYVRFLNIEF